MKPSSSLFSTVLSCAAAAALVWPTAEGRAQSVLFTEGVADLTFFYNGSPTLGTGSFDVVFRAKASTVATNLTSPYGTPPGGVGAATGSDVDYNFTTLTTQITQSPTVNLGGVNFFVTPGTGLGYTRNDELGMDQPDLGFRTRFRDVSLQDVDNPNGNQFSHLNMALNLGDSILPSGADFALFRTGVGLVATDVAINTAAADLVHNWGNWEHSHWHWGFSEVGSYTLVFDIFGHNGDEQAVTSMGSFTLGFEVIPEPSSAALLLGVAAVALAMSRRRRAV